MNSSYLFSLAVLVLASTPGPALCAAETNAPAVTRAKLAAFMQKWQTAPAYEDPTTAADWPLLVAALAKDPHGPWTRYLDTLAADARFQIRQVRWSERKAWAATLLSALEQAEQIQKQFKATGVTITNQPMAFVFERGHHPETRAFLSLEAGQNLDVLKASAQRQLASAKNTNDWNYGNLIFEANETLGRIAVKEGDFVEARRCLRAAAGTPGSPQLNSFGPDFVLPRELLEHGDKEDRDTVLAFLEDIRKLWGDLSIRPEANSRRVAEDHLRELDQWRQEIRAGKIPTHAKWR